MLHCTTLSLKLVVYEKITSVNFASIFFRSVLTNIMYKYKNIDLYFKEKKKKKNSSPIGLA